MHAAQPLGDPRQFLDDGEFRLQADVDGAHHFLGPRQGRAAQQHDGGLNAAFAQPADIFKARFGDAHDTPAQHGARHLRHAAGSLGDTKNLDA